MRTPRSFRGSNDLDPAWVEGTVAGAMGCAASVHSSAKPVTQRYNFVGPELRSPVQLEAVDWSDLCGVSVSQGDWLSLFMGILEYSTPQIQKDNT